MFLHAAKWGQKEVERLVCWGCRGSVSRPNLEADQSGMELVGYQTSHKEIWDIYHSVYLLRKSPGLPPCGSQQRRKAIHDILSSLRSQLHQQVYPTAAKEPSRIASYEEALQEIRAACKRVLETAKVLRSDIERLSQGMRDAPQTHSRSQSRSCSRSHGRSHSQSCPRSCSLDRWPRSPSRSQQGRRVTFQELEVELDPKEGEENDPPEPSILDVEMWLDWQACQPDMPCWWMELRAILGVEDPWKLTWKIWASFLIPEVRSWVFLRQDYTIPPAPKCLTQNMFLPDKLSYQDVWQQPFLLSLMPEDCSIGQRNSICWRAQTSTPW